MTDFKPLDFWIAVAVALLVKIKTSAQLGAWQVITTILVAIGAAWIGSDYAAEVFGVPLPVGDGHRHPNRGGRHALAIDRGE